jgi:hypothetical protein
LKQLKNLIVSLSKNSFYFVLNSFIRFYYVNLSYWQEIKLLYYSNGYVKSTSFLQNYSLRISNKDIRCDTRLEMFKFKTRMESVDFVIDMIYSLSRKFLDLYF